MIVVDAIGSGAREAFLMLWETLWALVLGFAISGAVQAFVSRGRMEQLLGPPGARSAVRATFLGMVSSSCSYAASAMAKSLFAKGADFTGAMVFMVASTNLVIELGIVLALLIGWQFTASEVVGGLLMIAMLVTVARFTLPRAWVEDARQRLRGADLAAPDGTAPAPRMRTLAGWSDAATYAIADITMLRRELVIGFGVAGFLSALVPDSAWNHIFLTGNGFWTSLENVVVGPLIAVVSFVCSIGNVPLAAALWKGGISFGGVVAFIFADLITLPLLLIYRRYYGRRLTAWILASFWLVMSAAGLVVELVFSALHLVPTTRPAQLAAQSVTLDYTTILDVVAIVVLVAMYVLSRNRARLGGGRGYTRDPICGMQLQEATAPARLLVAGQTVYFCSDRCRSRYRARDARSAPQGVGT